MPIFQSSVRSKEGNGCCCRGWKKAVEAIVNYSAEKGLSLHILKIAMSGKELHIGIVVIGKAKNTEEIFGNLWDMKDVGEFNWFKQCW